MNKACTKEENKELFQRILDGDEAAKERFIEGNMGYVVVVVSDFVKNNEKIKYLQDDLISEGYLTLIKISQTKNPVHNLQGFICACLRNTCVEMVMKDKPCERLKKNATYKEDGIKDMRQDILNCCEDNLDLRIIHLRHQGHNDLEIADICGVSQQYINKRRNDILKKLAI